MPANKPFDPKRLEAVMAVGYRVTLKDLGMLQMAKAALQAVEDRPKPNEVLVRLDPEHAELVRQQADGWLDAGATEDGLSKDENAALWSLVDQIRDAQSSTDDAANAPNR